MGRPAQAPAYLAPHVVDDGDEQQHTAHSEQDVLRAAHHPGQQHQLGVEHLKGLALHGPSLRTEGDKQAGATRRCHSMPRPCVSPTPARPCPVSGPLAKACARAWAKWEEAGCGGGGSFSSRATQGDYISQTPLQLDKAT